MTAYPYYRFISFTTYDDEGVRAFREDQWKSGNMKLPEDYCDFIWQFAKDHDEAKANHGHKLDLREVVLNAGFDEQETY